MTAGQAEIGGKAVAAHFAIDTAAMLDALAAGPAVDQDVPPAR